MMRESEKIIKEFADKLKRTEEYRLYIRKQEKVAEYPGLREEINQYRKEYYMLQKSEEGLFDKLDEFEKKYNKMRSNPVVDEYLEAELAVCKMMQEAYAQIADAIDLDIHSYLQ